MNSYQTHWLVASLVVTACLASSGCALCGNPFDEDYVTYGSRTPRSDMRHGRVGSPFSDPTPASTTPPPQLDALDNDYAEILENAESDSEAGPVFEDEPAVEPSILELPGPKAVETPIELVPGD
jgi:hypothetical protein